MLSFFLSTGVLSGYGQHLATIFSSQTKALRARAPPEVFIRCGGASGALFGVFAAFCMQYPNAGVGIIFVPISIAASTMLPCVMAFDLLGMVRGFGLGLGHAVSTDRCETCTLLIQHRPIYRAQWLGWPTRILMGRTKFGIL